MGKQVKLALLVLLLSYIGLMCVSCGDPNPYDRQYKLHVVKVADGRKYDMYVDSVTLKYIYKDGVAIPIIGTVVVEFNPYYKQ